VRANGFTHVSVHAYDLDESVHFYTELFEMEEVPAPDFPSPVRWLRVGDLQLHLFKSDDSAPRSHHFGLDVDDFEAIYQKANELGVAEGEGRFPDIYELPDGAVQLYLRDPAGNVVEVNWRDASTLDRSVIGETQKIEGDAEVTLYLRQQR
jgi:catechol 2,3-dioxygenase-like lactoylglutathione lyase family enzyme